MAELIALSDTAEPAGRLKQKYTELLATPFTGVNSQRLASRTAPNRSKPVVRVAAWNIETGVDFELIRLAFTDPLRLDQAVRKLNAALPENERADREDIAAARAEAEHLRHSDILILNEVDLGMPRSEYRDVARELAAALGTDYAFGVEFIEVDKIHLGIESLPALKEVRDEKFAQRPSVDKARYRGLQGTAILSRYPIRSARNIRLKGCYDWYSTEKYFIDNLAENGRRFTAKQVFLERISREVRHGGRFALAVELEVPESPTGRLMAVAAHLENKTRPDCRREQMEELLHELRDVRHPLVLGGDLNTSGTDAAPTSIARELRKRARSPNFWASQAIGWFSPSPFANVIFGCTKYWRNYRDPTARNIPLVAPNGDAQLFDMLEDFQFADGGAFDFSGDKERSANGRGGTLSNSNERARKGFRPTFEFKRDYKGFAGQMRLDWLLVKPSASTGDTAGRFAPRNGRTLEHVNEAAPGRISDHHPITVDLPLDVLKAASGPDTRAKPTPGDGNRSNPSTRRISRRPSAN
jgi:endonuclease/exonuclease/phosphatase family metal-dependent hydrolase